MSVLLKSPWKCSTAMQTTENKTRYLFFRMILRLHYIHFTVLGDLRLVFPNKNHIAKYNASLNNGAPDPDVLDV